MPTALQFEAQLDGRTWTALALQVYGMPPATLSDIKHDRRDIYVIQVFADHATISRLRGGIDVEQGIARFIDPTELQNAELVRRLEIGESHEMTLKPERAPQPTTFRFRCISP